MPSVWLEVIKLFWELVEQLTVARLSKTLSSRLETSLVISTLTLLLSTLTRLVSEMDATFSSASAIWKLVTGSKVKVPGPAEEKS